jgi:hypothetical protein
VREIFAGHWAWCEELASKGQSDPFQNCSKANTERRLGSKKKPSKQYEVIAVEDFEEEDFIGEYVGKVIYQKVTLQKTVITLYGNDI